MRSQDGEEQRHRAILAAKEEQQAESEELREERDLGPGG